MNEKNDGSDFWGDSPDWTATGDHTPRRMPRPDGGSERTDISGAMKNLWSAALTSGANPTREHRIVDAAALPESVQSASDWNDDPDETPAIGRVRDVSGQPMDDTNEYVRSADERDDISVSLAPLFGDRSDSSTLGADLRDRRLGGGVDPRLVRIGAAVMVVALAIPLAIGITSDDDGDTIVSSEADVAMSTPPVVTFDLGDAIDPNAKGGDDSAAGAEAAPVADTSIDPSDLPPATPVVTDLAEAGATDESAASSTAVADVTEAKESEPADEESTDATADDATTTDDATTADDATTTDEGSSDEESTTDREPTDDEAADATATDEGASDETASATTLTISDPASADGDAERVDNCAIDFEVRAGDYWLLLADEAGVPIAELLEANDATVDTPLFPGDDICLPAGSTTPSDDGDTADSSDIETTTTVSVETTVTTVTTVTTDEPATTATTVAPETTTTTPATDAPGTDATPEQVKAIIREIWPDELEDRAIEIAYRESRFDPLAKNFCCYGVFQMYWEVHQSWLMEMGITSDDQLYDPTNNVRAAYALYQRAGGWGPWGF